MTRFRHRTRWQIALRYSGLPVNVRAVAWALGTWLPQDGETRTPPSLPELAKAAGVGLSTVKRALERLDKDGWIFRASARGRGHRTRYVATIPAAAEEQMEAVLNRSTGGPISSEKTAQGNYKNGPLDDGKRPAAVGRMPLVPEEQPESASPHVPKQPLPWVALGMTWREWNQAMKEKEAG